jgi:hypothetical protein
MHLGFQTDHPRLDRYLTLRLSWPVSPPATPIYLEADVVIAMSVTGVHIWDVPVSAFTPEIFRVLQTLITIIRRILTSTL